MIVWDTINQEKKLICQQKKRNCCLIDRIFKGMYNSYCFLVTPLLYILNNHLSTLDFKDKRNTAMK